MLNLRKSLLAAACIAACAGPAAAVTITEAFDGAWVDNGDVGANKGLLVDYIPSANIVFFAFFTYDEDGNPIWVTHNFSLDGSNSDYTGDILYFTGGAFSAGGNPAQEVIGSYDISFACGNIQLDFEPTAESGLQPVSFDMVQVADSMSGAECVDAIAECPAGTTADGDACRLPSSIAQNMHLPAGKDYTILGQTTVEEGAKLSIAPGVTVRGAADDGQPNFLFVDQGAQIYANGTRELPITFAGPTDDVGSWAGLVIAGRSSCNDAGEGQPCQFEAVPSITYGGDDVADNSGVLRYVRIVNAGQAVAPDEELNALTLLAVGSGTTIEHVQMDHGLDDGVEFFGGTVNARYMVCSNMTDDCFDMDQGYSGKLQFLLAYQGEPGSFTNDPNGVESDNDSNNNDKQPRTAPMVSNFTLVGSAGGVNGEALKIRRGSGGNYANVVATGYADVCLNLDDAGTFALASGTEQGEELSFTNSMLGGCGVSTFEDAGADPYAVSDFYAAGAGNAEGAPAIQGGFLPPAGASYLTGGQSHSDPFFTPTTYKGAFAGPNDNWTAGWTVNIP